MMNAEAGMVRLSSLSQDSLSLVLVLSQGRFLVRHGVGAGPSGEEACIGEHLYVGSFLGHR